jgi:hypothetical protein
MTIISLLIKELEAEALTTRKMLALVPADKMDWQPHPKSMKMGVLATHISELPTWVTMVFKSDELDFATAPYNPPKFSSNAELMAYFEKCLADGRSELLESNTHLLDKTWTLRTGDNIHYANPKIDMIRQSLSQIIHHRAQLGVYLRLLNIPIPGSYGPSADEMNS